MLNKYFLHQQMPVVASRYWNMVHGNTPDEVRQDAEGLQVMRVLGRNMAWLLRLKEAGEQAGVLPRSRKKHGWPPIISGRRRPAGDYHALSRAESAEEDLPAEGFSEDQIVKRPAFLTRDGQREAI